MSRSKLPFRSAMTFLACVWIAACGSHGGKPPATQPPWGEMGLRRVSELSFSPGTETFAGTQVSVVGRDEKTGAMALYVKLPPTPLDKRLHYHTGSAHSIILEGSVTSMTEDGEVVTLKPGDYFRESANELHASSGSETGALIFMITDGPFETRMYEEGSPKPNATATWGAGLKRRNELRFTAGTGTFTGTQVSVLGRDERTGAMAAFVKLPAGMELDKRMHYHTGSAHSIVIEGSVSSMDENGEVHTLGPGDYFREAANHLHSGSGSEAGALVLMVMDGPEFETRMAQR